MMNYEVCEKIQKSKEGTFSNLKTAYLYQKHLKNSNLPYLYYSYNVSNELILKQNIEIIESNIFKQLEYLKVHYSDYLTSQDFLIKQNLRNEVIKQDRKWITTVLEIMEKTHLAVFKGTDKVNSRVSYNNIHKIIYQDVYTGIYNIPEVKEVVKTFRPTLQHTQSTIEALKARYQEYSAKVQSSEPYTEYIKNRLLRNISILEETKATYQTTRMQNLYDNGLVECGSYDTNKYNIYIVRNNKVYSVWKSSFSDREVLIDETGTLLYTTNNFLYGDNNATN